MPLIPAQEELCECETSLVCIPSSRLGKETQTQREVGRGPMASQVISHSALSPVGLIHAETLLYNLVSRRPETQARETGLTPQLLQASALLAHVSA